MPPPEGTGLRARKKQQTRLAISDVATGLFIARGFDAVTIAEVADAAQVSVGTVFNYFKTKEELFFDRADEVEDAASRIVRERRPGDSAVRALRRTLDEVIRDGSGPLRARNLKAFVETVEESEALKARARLLFERAEERLAKTLIDETGAQAGDARARAVAAAIMGVLGLLAREFQAAVMRGDSAAKYRAALARLCESGFAVLEAGASDYAVRTK